jgi:hypothetical protein
MMSKVGKEYIQVKSMRKCLVVYEGQKGFASPGEILVRHESGQREWLSHQQLDDDYVEAF